MALEVFLDVIQKGFGNWGFHVPFLTCLCTTHSAPLSYTEFHINHSRIHHISSSPWALQPLMVAFRIINTSKADPPFEKPERKKMKTTYCPYCKEGNCPVGGGGRNYDQMMKPFILLITQSSVQVYFESERAEGLGGGKSPCVFTDTLQPGEAPAQRPSWEQPPPACLGEVSPFSPRQQWEGKAVPLCSTGHCQDQISMHYLIWMQ